MQFITQTLFGNKFQPEVAESWNRTRTDAELRAFVESKHALLPADLEF